MKFTSGKAFQAQTHYRVSIMAMSGMGKTHIGRILSTDNWFHYSADYRIGTRYLMEEILDQLKIRMMNDAILRDLLRSDSCYLAHNLTVDNLNLLSQFIGKYGDRAKGGLDLETFLHRQNLYSEAEKKSQYDLANFIKKSDRIYGYPHFLNDTTGSVCEIIDIENPNCPVLKAICDHTLLLYIEADAEDEALITERQYQNPKPMFYNLDFFEQIRREIDNDSIEPDEFLRIIFPRTLAFRKARYDYIAKHYGYHIKGKDFARVASNDDFTALISDAIDSQNKS